MPRIKGPNGLAIPVSEAVAAALLRDKASGFELVEDKAAAKPSEKPVTKKAAAKPSDA